MSCVWKVFQLMGKTPKPLKILVTDLDMIDWDEIQKLKDQNHIVHTSEEYELSEYDLVIGPNCWRMDDALYPFLDLAIKEARARAYPG